MEQAIGLRLSKELLRKAEALGKEEMEDRSTVLRKAIAKGMQDMLAKRAAEKYVQGKITLSEAAHQAEITLWDMEKYLIDNGFTSRYSLEDLDHELQLLQ
jgi:predicted HTH domain antitoxin